MSHAEFGFTPIYQLLTSWHIYFSLWYFFLNCLNASGRHYNTQPLNSSACISKELKYFWHSPCNIWDILGHSMFLLAKYGSSVLRVGPAGVARHALALQIHRLGFGQIRHDVLTLWAWESQCHNFLICKMGPCRERVRLRDHVHKALAQHLTPGDSKRVAAGRGSNGNCLSLSWMAGEGDKNKETTVLEILAAVCMNCALFLPSLLRVCVYTQTHTHIHTTWSEIHSGFLSKCPGMWGGGKEHIKGAGKANTLEGKIWIE